MSEVNYNRSEPLTPCESVAAGVAILWPMIFVAVATIICGCAVTKAEWGGETVITDCDGNPLVISGVVQKVKLPTKLYSNRHWFDSHIDQAKLVVDKDKIEFGLNGYDGVTSTNAIAYIDTCFSGIATITEKVCAAIATSGGSVAASGGSAAISALAARFISAGGDVAKATAICSDGKCSVTDGCVTCSESGCTSCSSCQKCSE